MKRERERTEHPPLVRKGKIDHDASIMCKSRGHKRKLLPAKVLSLPALDAFLPAFAFVATHLFLPLGQWQSALPPQDHGMAMLRGMFLVGGQDGPQPPGPGRGACRTPVATGIVEDELQDQHPSLLLTSGVHHQLIAPCQPTRAPMLHHGESQAFRLPMFQAQGQGQERHQPLHCEKLRRSFAPS